MGSLRSYFRWTYGTATLGVGIFLLTATIFYVVHGVNHRAKIQLKLIGHSFVKAVEEFGADPLTPQTAQELAARLHWADPEDRISVYVTDLHDRPWFSHSEEAGAAYTPPAWKAPSGSYYRFEARMKDPERWHYTMWYERGGLRITLQKFDEYETLEDLLIGGGIFLTILLSFSYVFGQRLAHNLLRPIERISSVTRDLRGGDLDARIDIPPTQREIAELAANLNRTFAELQQLYKQASEFSANAAHELRTPLTALRGKIEVALRAERAVDEYQGTLCECVDEIATLQRIVDSLLLLSRPPERWDSGIFESLDLADICRQTLDPITALAEDRGMTVHADLPADLRVHGVSTFLSQLVYNLLHNAITYSYTGATIRIALDRLPDGPIRLRVSDDGIGMTPDACQRIFDRFYQVDTSRNHGTGLGLSLVKYIADIHHARIDVQSSPGEGSTFTITFPALPPRPGGPSPRAPATA